jgi:steroid 5-alpha reductase family enzyme
MKNYGSHKKSNRPDRRRTRITYHLHPTSSSSPTAHKMSQELTILGISAAITAVIQLSGFAVAYKFQTETFYDILGGINFLTLGIYSAIDGTSSSPFFSSSRKVAATAIFLVSRGWLLLFLAWRAHERKGDGRFDEIKTSFVWFLVAWVFQGVWVFTISLPVIFVNGSDNVVNDDGNWSGLEYCAMVGFALGVFFGMLIDCVVWCGVTLAYYYHYYYHD